MSNGLNKSEFFKITEIDHKKKLVVVEDEEFGLSFTVQNLDGDWVSAEICDRYAVKFEYTDQDPLIIKIME